MKSLLASLSDHSMAMLRGIASLRLVTLASNVRDEAAAQLAAALAEKASVDEALAACSGAARSAWSALCAAGGRMKVTAFSRLSGSMIRPIGPGKLERELTWQQPEGAAEELWYRGLIFRAFADLGNGPAEYFYIPDDLLLDDALGEIGSAPGETGPTGPLRGALQPTTAPAHERQALNSLAVDLCTLLANARETPLRIAAGEAGRWCPADPSRLAEGLLLQDGVRLELLLALARGSGLLVIERGKMVVNTPAATAWLRGTHWEQMTELFVGWRESTDAGPVPGSSSAESGRGPKAMVDWNDLRRTPALQAEGNWRNDPLLARRALLTILHGAEASSWYTISDLAALVKAVNPDFQRPDGDYHSWYLRDETSSQYLSGFESWDGVEGRLISFLITGPLFWLGAVSLAMAEDGPVSSFRLTPYGVAWLANALPRELPRPARLAVNEVFSVVAPLWLPLNDRFRLLRFTEHAGGSYDWGASTRHRITRGSLSRARAAGVKAEAILKFLHRSSGDRVPPRIASALARWSQQGGAVRINRGAVLRVEDAAILAGLRADPVIAPLLGELLSAQAVLIRETDLPGLLAVLAESGYTVRVD